MSIIVFPASLRVGLHVHVVVEAWSPDRHANMHRIMVTTDRRELLESILLTVSTASTAVAVEAAAPKCAWASGDSGDMVEALACRPNTKLMSKVSTAREKIEMAVQASSVQAWPSAAESINDPILDESKLSALLLESCVASPSYQNHLVIREILEGVQTMRSKLNGVEKLATEDAMAVMSLGTATRSSIDWLFQL